VQVWGVWGGPNWPFFLVLGGTLGFARFSRKCTISRFFAVLAPPLVFPCFGGFPLRFCSFGGPKCPFSRFPEFPEFPEFPVLGPPGTPFFLNFFKFRQSFPNFLRWGTIVQFPYTLPTVIERSYGKETH